VSGEVGTYTSEGWRTCSQKPLRLRLTISVSVEIISTSGYGCCFYFRFAPDAVLRGRMMSVEVDWACPRTVSQPLTSRWYLCSRHQLITTSGFRPPSWIYKCVGLSVKHGWRGYDGKNLRTTIIGISLVTSLYSTWHTAGGNGEGLIDPLNLPSPLLSTYVMRDTCNKRVRPNKFTVPNSIAYSLYYSLFSLFETCERLDVTAWSKSWIMVIGEINGSQYRSK